MHLLRIKRSPTEDQAKFPLIFMRTLGGARKTIPRAWTDPSGLVRAGIMQALILSGIK